MIPIEMMKYKDLYYYFFNNCNDAIYFHQLDGKFLEVNDVACQRMGYSRQEFREMTVLDIDAGSGLDPEGQERFAANGYIITRQVHRRKDGTTLPVELNARLIEMEGKKMVLTIARDITERVHAEEEIRNQHRELQSLYQDTEEKAKRLSAVNEIIMAISSTLDLKELLEVFCRETSKLIKMDYMWVSLIEEGTDNFKVFPVSLGNRSDPFYLGSVQETATICGRVVRNKQPVIRQDTCVQPAEFNRDLNMFREFGVRSYIVLPLLMKNRVIGTFSVGTNEPGVYQNSDLELLRPMAGQLAVAIENSRMYERVHELAVLRERDRIAREIHDSEAQVLGYIISTCQLIQKLLEIGRVEEALEKTRIMEEHAQEAYTDAREAISGLRLPALESDFGDWVRNFAAKFGEKWGVKIDVTFDQKLQQLFLSPKIGVQLQRVVQETLANVRKHAKASSVWVSIKLEGSNLWLSVRDNGLGFDQSVKEPEQFGLKIMRERIESIGGHFEIKSGPGAGTQVLFIVPAFPGQDSDGMSSWYVGGIENGAR